MDSGTRRNFVAYYLNFIVTAIVGIIVNPLLLAALGPLMFGVWKSLQRFLDFASVADGQASQGLKWIVATRAAHPAEELRRDVGATMIVWLRWLPAAILVAATVTLAMPWLIKGLTADAQSMAYATAAILAANTVLAGLLTIPNSVLVGVNQGYKSMLILTGAFVVSNGAMIAVASIRWPLWSLAIIVLATAIANGALTRLVAKRSVDWWGASRPTKADLRRVFGYSSWTLGWVAVDKLFLACELIVISISAGALAVTQYTFTSYVMQFVLSIAMVTASGFIPTLGSQLGASQIAAAAECAKTVRQMVIGVAVLGSSAVLAFNGTFVSMWVGQDQFLGTALNTLLVTCGLLFALVRMDGQILDVTMRIGPKVMLGLVSSGGGILAGCLTFAATHSLISALVAVICLRLISNVTFPVLVARAIPGSGVPLRPLLLAAGFLILSFGNGLLIQASTLPIQLALALGWLLLAFAATWFGLMPRATLHALLTRRSSSPGN